MIAPFRRFKYCITCPESPRQEAAIGNYCRECYDALAGLWARNQTDGRQRETADPEREMRIKLYAATVAAGYRLFEPGRRT